jgi:hypothetical protein
MDSLNSLYSKTNQHHDTEHLLDATINEDLTQQRKKINKIKILLIITLIISLCAFIIGTINLVEYNVVLHNFDGFSGIETFINKSTVVINELTSIINKVNQTETEIYIRKLRIIIDKACQTMHC